MYILFEGIDGVGKSTQIKKISQFYNDVLITKEPGATPFGDKIRDILLHGKFDLSKKAEMFLFLADRAEHTQSVIEKNQDKLILSDRGFVSGISYAITNDSELNFDTLLSFNKFALNNNMPDKIIFFKADESLILKRFKLRNKKDTIEKRGIKYLLQVQENMENTIDKLGIESLKIDATLKKDEITKQIINFINLDKDRI
ncbi:dTMP kinase [Campylobacter pinnipediorum subsp. caledonicus]|uniref:Thymidylate kinase n=1 Tax=Campylobacter pinnipediorum subsp. caledonicus TaxID=1874362 RepID=A0A1S6U7X1_9BACT|nr:dTMP kinase [Campylobacter pinnipediorum]AQW87557.1 dTMP kinase [Campylobacter pinnipediorum subsp. caledonicus]